MKRPQSVVESTTVAKRRLRDNHPAKRLKNDFVIKRLKTTPPPLERHEHLIVAQWLNAKGLLWLHPANESKRSPATGALMKRMGVSAGAPDIIVFESVLGEYSARYYGAVIEMKRRGATMSSVSPAQLQWMTALEARGWATRVAFGADEAIAFLEKLYAEHWRLR